MMSDEGRGASFLTFITHHSAFIISFSPGCARLWLTRKMPFLYSCGARPLCCAHRRRPKVSLGPYSSAVFMLHRGGFFVKHASRLPRPAGVKKRHFTRKLEP